MEEFEGIVLNAGERVISRIEKSKLGMLGGLIVFLLLLVIGIVVYAVTGVFSSAEEYSYSKTMGLTYGSLLIFFGALYFLLVWLSYRHVKLVLTDRRVIGSTGMVSRNNIDIPLSKVDAVNLQRGLFGALFGYYSVQVFSPSTALVSRKKGLVFRYAKNAVTFKNALVEELDRMQNLQNPSAAYGAAYGQSVPPQSGQIAQGMPQAGQAVPPQGAAQPAAAPYLPNAAQPQYGQAGQTVSAPQGASQAQNAPQNGIPPQGGSNVPPQSGGR